MKVFYSFPHKIGADRICGIAWHQVEGLHAAGAEVVLCAGAVHRPLPSGIKVQTTLAWNGLRLPYRVLGSMRSFALHDWRAARALRRLKGEINAVHVWPLGARETLKTAAELGIPTFLERCNAHTRFAYEVVQKECDRLGVILPADQEHAYKKDVLEKEEEEYRLADRLLCPSDFVVKSFINEGFKPEKLVRHIYGFNEDVFYPNGQADRRDTGLTMIFVGVCAVRKGVHYALEAWLRSSAHRNGTFLIAGEFLPAYAEKLSPLLCHPSIKVLGHRSDIAELMRKSDILVLPSIEEGFGLVVAEAMGSGCVPLISDACTDICKHMENGLVHRVGDVAALSQHITMLDQDRELLARLRAACLRTGPEVTWKAAGVRLLEAYRGALSR